MRYELLDVLMVIAILVLGVTLGTIIGQTAILLLES